MNVKYVSNTQGKVTVVHLPLKEWQEVSKKLEAFTRTESIKTGYEAMQRIEKGSLLIRTLDSFLDEL
ncbi:hypothetical protein C5O19_15510 [Siphonobacter curvatus]|uniref:Prevent-host-death protein n=1 Tax=Siphonobacter curvatus TaxID=2094562 RepID=A0A2S7IJD6_9BACT|nr:hypothetical protein C5O19_15510 [Siphonobacter curvatus]